MQQPHVRHLFRTAAANRSSACWLPHIWRSSSQRRTPADVLKGRIAAFCSSRVPAVRAAAIHAAPVVSSGGSSNSLFGRRQLTLGAALAAASAGVTPWSRAGAAVSSGSRGAAMATAAAAGGSSAGTSDTGILVVYVTAPSAEVADSLASALVESQLAACVNIVPGLTSVYTWKGKVEKDPEVLMIIKTQAHLLDSLTAKVKQLHPYDEPEVVALPVVGGSASYMTWVRDSTAGAKKD